MHPTKGIRRHEGGDNGSTYVKIQPGLPMEKKVSGRQDDESTGWIASRPDRPRPTAKATRLMASRRERFVGARSDLVIHALPLEDCAPPIEVGL